MAGIEFLPENPGDAEVEEVLDSGPRRQFPRWLVLLVLGAVAVGTAVIVAVQSGDDARPPPPSAQPSARLPLSITADDDIGAPLAVGAGKPVLDVAMSGDSEWLLQARDLNGIGLPGKNPHATVPGLPLVTEASNAAARLELDVQADRLWVVVLGDKHGRALEYDALTLRLMREVGSIGSANGAAALDGHLYLTRGNRVLDVPPDGPLRTVATVPDTLGPIVADPERGRLLVLDFGERTRVWAVTPRAGATPLTKAPVSIGVTKGSVAVVNGAIWLAGFDTGDGVLMELDPTTLRPKLHSSLDSALEPGAIAVAGGQSVLWVRDGGGSQLRCLDATTGRQLQAWMIDGQVASTNSGALVATSGGAVPLVLSRCAG